MKHMLRNCLSCLCLFYFISVSYSQFITYTKAESAFGKERIFFHFLTGNGSYHTPRIYPQYLMDAHRLHKAIIKKNADIIICILGRRTNYERQEIKDYYTKFYVQTLEQRMSRLSDENFRNLVLSLLKDLPNYLAELLRVALYSDKFSTVTYTSIGLWNVEAFTVKEIYDKSNQSDLLKDITETTCGEYQNGLKCLFTTNRENIPIQRKTKDDNVRWTPAVYPESAMTDAKVLYESLHRPECLCGGNTTDIFCEVAPFQLNLTAAIYKQLYGTNLEDDIIKSTSGNQRELYLALLRYGTSRGELYAKLLHAVLTKAEVDYEVLNRIVITRSEIDMDDIIQAYRRLYGRPLADQIASRTKGYYRLLLLTLLGHNQKCPFYPIEKC